jgi:hypothetical protein
LFQHGFYKFNICGVKNQLKYKVVDSTAQAKLIYVYSLAFKYQSTIKRRLLRMKRVILLILLAINMACIKIEAQELQNLFPRLIKAFTELKDSCNVDKWSVKTYQELVTRDIAPRIVLGRPLQLDKSYDLISVFNLSNNNIQGRIPDAFWRNSEFMDDNFRADSPDDGKKFSFVALFDQSKVIMSHNSITDIGYMFGYASMGTMSVIKFDNNKLTHFRSVYPSEYCNSPMFGGIGSGILTLCIHQNDITKMTKEDFGHSWYISPRNRSILSNRAKEFRIDNNRLDFTSLIEVVDYATTRVTESDDFKLDYMPQKPLGGDETVVKLNRGAVHDLQFSLSHADNVYEWELNGVHMPVFKGKKISVIVNEDNAGVYRCRVTNPKLPGAVLYSYDMCVFMNKDGNSAATDFNITLPNISANYPEGAVLGDFEGTDPDGDELFYRLPDKTASNSAFRIINGKTLISAEPLFDADYLTSYTIEVIAYDRFGNEKRKEIIIERDNESTVTLPSDIKLSSNRVVENKEDAVIGNLSVVGANGFVLSLDNGGDNDKFTISESVLKTKNGLNHEESGAVNVRIIAQNSRGASIKKSFTVYVDNINDTPHNIDISNRIVKVDEPSNSIVGVLLAFDEDIADNQFVFSLAEGEGDTNNKQFSTDGKNLRTSYIFRKDDAGTKSVRVRVSDPHGAAYEGVITLEVKNNVVQNMKPRGFGLTNTVIWPELKEDDVIALLFASDSEGSVCEFTTDSDVVYVDGNKLLLKKRPEPGAKTTVNIVCTDGNSEVSANIVLYTPKDGGTSAVNSSKFRELNIYPNPSNSMVYFNISGNIRVYNNSGILVINREVNGSLDVSSLSPGIYFAYIESDNVVYKSKLVID